MTKAQHVADAKRVVGELIKELYDLAKRSALSNDYQAGYEKLLRWKERAVRELKQHVHENEGNRLASREKWSFRAGDPLGNLLDESAMYNAVLGALLEDLKRRPRDILDAPVPAANLPEIPKVKSPNTNVVFIIHGHDELNLLRLKSVIREQWKLEPVVLASTAGKGRSMIEKFEQEAQRACFAVALLTPDDNISSEKGEYAQARPNVVFELGWFYGRLGRERVTILLKKGTKLHSDLEGISRIEFKESVEETATHIEKELVAVGVLKKQKG